MNEDLVWLEDLVCFKDLDILNWADILKFPAETKGNVIEIRPKVIIVTSNLNIRDLCLKSRVKTEN